MSAGDFELVDFDSVLEEYRAALEARLRGFSWGPSFLEGFVPDEDPVKAAANLLEAAQGAGLSGLRIRFSRTEIDPDRLREMAREFGELRVSEVDRGMQIEVRFAPTNAQSELRVPAPKRGSRPLARDEAPELPAEMLVSRYRGRALDALRQPLHEGRAPSGKAIRVETTEASLTIDIDANHAVECARFTVTGVHVARRNSLSVTGSVSDDLLRGALEVFCRIIEGLPILEAADHGAHRLAQALADQSRPRPVSGVLLPEHGGRAFVIATELVRRVLATYREQTGFSELENRDLLEPGADWQKLDDAARLAKIRAVLPELCAALGLAEDALSASAIRAKTKILIEFSPALSASERRRALFAIEAELKRRIDPSLEVETAPRKDLNVIRRL